MFELLRVLLWILIIYIFWYLILQFFSKKFLAFLGGGLLIFFIILAFFNPTDEAASVVWTIFSSFFFQPLGLVLVLLGSGLAAGAGKGNGGRQVQIAAVLLLLLSLPFVSQRMANFFIEQEAFALRQSAGETLPSGEAIVLLGWETTQPQEGQRTPRLLDAGDRVVEAARLYRQGSAPQIVVSAGPRLGDTPPPDQEPIPEAEDIRQVLISTGIPAGAIRVDPTGRGVRSSARGVREVLAPNSPDRRPRIVLVTSSLNMRRAKDSFEQLNFEVVPVPAGDYVAAPTIEGDVDPLDFLPNVRALTTSSRIVEEYLARIYYFVRGWMTL